VNTVEIVVNVSAGAIVGTALLAAIFYLPWRMRDAYRQTFIALARAVESREPYLVGHSEKTARYVVLMSRWCGMTLWETRHLEHAALLHGIGKVSVPYGLLNNPDPLISSALQPSLSTSLTATDRFVLRDYVRVGTAIVDAIPLLRPAADIVRYHREYLDGSGYPFGQYGSGIPFRAQMLCVASEYVAMTSPRLYRKGIAMTSSLVITHLRNQAGQRYHYGAVLLFLLAKKGEDCWLSARSLAHQIPWKHIPLIPKRLL